MHYKNGRPAKNGDKVVLIPDWVGGVPVAGVLVDAKPGITHCNGYLAPITHGIQAADLSRCLHVDDFQALMKIAGEAPDMSPIDPVAG